MLPETDPLTGTGKKWNNHMELYTIPIEDKFIIYRPLLRLAFVGNRAMAELASRLAGGDSTEDIGVPEDAHAFLDEIGFFNPDPPPPPAPPRDYHPTAAVLLLTNRCNLRCTYCYAGGGEGPDETLSPAMARATIDLAHRNAELQGRKQFELTFHGGGEPVKAWDVLCESVAHARSKSLPCHISMVSNGAWTASQRDWIVHNLNNLSISFDGRPQTQDRQRPFPSGRGSSRTVLLAIQTLDKVGFHYGIRMTATAPWEEDLPEDVRFICRETGCHAMQVEPAFNTQRGEHRGPTLEQSEAFAAAFTSAYEIARGANRHLTYSGARPWLHTQSFCSAPYHALIVNPGGDLVSCYEITAGHHPLAQLSRIGSVAGEDVSVNREARERLLEHLAEQRRQCKGCFCYWHCAGDCYTRASSARERTGHSPSARCFMNRQITARILLWYIMEHDGVWRGQGANPAEVRLMRAF